ncbi:MAG: hypothetical protein J6U42_06120, partial [Lachnospiraceae bacterium]|nr:hypothetical protein [Lachnospiraceae bacterium]
VRIYYEDVQFDQCVPNVQEPYKADGVDDRSGLLYELVKPGVTEERDFSVAATDDKLTVIVVGDAKLLKIVVTPQEVKEAGKKRTVYVIGDSLVANYNSSQYPMTGWGQMLHEFFTDDIVISNRAIGGRSTLNFMNQGRLNDVLLNVRPGDYVLVTFGHNDGGSVAGRACTTSAYKRYLEDLYIEGVRQRGGIPVMVTLGNQNIFRNGEIAQSSPDYVKAMREAASEKDCLLIDLNEKSKAYFQEMHDTYGWGFLSDMVFNAFRAGIYDNALNGAADSTHFQKYGATKLAEFVAEGIAEQKFAGLYEFYKAPVTYDKIPGKVSGLKTDLKKYDKAYTHMAWKEVKNADHYVIERASMDRSGFITDFEVLGYSPVAMFADPDRESDKAYMYRVFAVNNRGRSEEPSEYVFIGTDGVKEDDFRRRLENGMIGDGGAIEPEETPTPAVTADTGNSTDIPVDTDDKNDKKEQKAFPFVLAGAGVFAVLLAAGILIYAKRKNKM